MNPAETFRLSVSERLEAAAEEIFLLFQRSVAQYEEQIRRQQRLLDVVWKPRVKLHRIDFLEPSVSEEEQQQDEEEHLEDVEEKEQDEQFEETQEEVDVLREQQLWDHGREHEVKPEPQLKEEEEEEDDAQLKEMDGENHEQLEEDEYDEVVLGEQHLWDLRHQERNYEVKPEPLVMEEELQEVKQESDDVPLSCSHEESENRCLSWKHNGRVDTPPQLSPAAEGHQHQPPAYQAAGLNGVHLGTTSDETFLQIPKQLTHKAPGSATQETTHICTVCNGVFSTENILADHRREIHADEKPFKCQTCGQTFRTSGYMRKHSLVHNHTTCPHPGCGKVFMKIRYLKNHMIIHSKEKPHQCNTCEKQFRRSDNLLKHIRTHTGEKPYCCHFCGKCFTAKGSLNTHLTIHTGERPYSCKLCGKSFATRSGFRLHKMIHTSDQQYECKLCGQRFNLLYYLNIHHKKHHFNQAMSYQVIQHSGAQPQEKEPSGPSGGR